MARTSSVDVTPAARAVSVTPRIRLFTDQVVVDRGDSFDECTAALLRLDFKYNGTAVRASDPSDCIFHADGGTMRTVARDLAAEAHARQALERYGAVDLDCLDTWGVSPDCEADYLVRLEGDVHQHCAFTSDALPELAELGFEIEVAPDYPYQVVQGDVSWYATVEEEEDRPDWFNLELGVDVDGNRIDLLQVLVDLLDESDGGSLVSLSSDRQYALPISPTHHVTVSPERLRGLLKVVIELYEDTDDGALRFSAEQAAALTRLDEVFAGPADSEAVLTWEGADEARQRGQRLMRFPKPNVREPEGLQATLRPYQREGLAWLQHLRMCEVGGILADDMGLGKTLQTITHVTTEKAEGRLDEPCIVVAPTSLVGNWKREFEKFAPHMKVVVIHGPKRHGRYAEIRDADVVITSYPILVRDLERFDGRVFHMAILDEAHTIKNKRSRNHDACQALQARHRLCITGTPVENHLGELWALFHWLNPGLLGDENRFRQWYQVPIERDGDEPRLESLREQVAPYILRRLKKEVAKDLPAKTELVRPVELVGKQRELYEHIRVAAHGQVRQLIKKKGFAASKIPILDALMKLRQVCCDPRLVKMQAARFVKTSAKYEKLLTMFDDLLPSGHRVLVFSQFTQMLGLISQGLKEKGIKHLTLTGTSRNRQGLVDAFEAGKADIFLLSLKAAGVGLNLTSADTVIHYDHWWNPQAQAQATDRAYRIGQTRPVFVHNLVVAGSVEERMLKLQARKRRLADAILGTDTQTELLTEEDLDLLFAPLVD